jgi:hypothetical protein
MFMITSTDDETIDTIISEIENLYPGYPGLTETRGKILNCIGVTFSYEVPRKVKINMDGFIKD